MEQHSSVGTNLPKWRENVACGKNMFHVVDINKVDTLLSPCSESEIILQGNIKVACKLLFISVLGMEIPDLKVPYFLGK